MDFEEYVAVHYTRLLRTAYLLTGEQSAAQDLLQETLVRAYRYSRRGRVEQPGAFIRRCLVNQYLSDRRRRSSGEIPTEPAAIPEPLSVDESGGIVAREVMWQALAQLPRHQRAILVLRFYEDLTESQIADALGVSVGAVRSGGSRGLTRLRTAMTAQHQEEPLG